MNAKYVSDSDSFLVNGITTNQHWLNRIWKFEECEIYFYVFIGTFKHIFLVTVSLLFELLMT